MASIQSNKNIFCAADYGACGDGETLNTGALQAAVDACNQAGGGTVYVEPGRYRTGTITLKSGVTFYLEAGAVVFGSTEMKDYLPDAYCRTVTRGALFYGRNIENVTIAGPGCIDGSGPAFWETTYCNATALTPKKLRPHALFLIAESENIIFKEITLTNSPCYTLWLLGCDRVQITGITIDNPLNGPNTDAIDIDCSSNVRISDCHIVAGDDCLALKSDAKRLGHNKACQNITVSNCSLRSSTCAIRVGYEGDEAIKNCVFSNLVIYDSVKGIDIISILPDLPQPRFTDIDEGPRIEGVLFSNIVMENVTNAIYIWQGIETNGVFQGSIANIAIVNMIARVRDFCFIGGIAERPITDIALRNVKIAIAEANTARTFEVPGVWGGDKVPWGIYCRHIQGLVLDQVEVEMTSDAVNWLGILKCEAVTDGDIHGLRCRHPLCAAESAAVTLAQSKNIFVHHCHPLSKVPYFLRLEGRDTASITLSSNDLTQAEKAFELAGDVDKNSLSAVSNILPDLSVDKNR